jgi:hypothetical protein
MKEALQSLIDRFQGVRHSWPQVPQAAFSRDHVWYAGLAVCPAEFSQQLVNLQLSLQGQPLPAPNSPEKTPTQVTH